MNNPNDSKQTSLSGGEKFVAINLLSKIGAVFVIASVIAFSAASEGHIPDIIRLVLVLAVGLIMLGAGELFWRKGSKVFANAMIYGGAIELMVCAPVGKYGLHIFDNSGMIVYSTIAAAAGFLLAWRYKSHGLTIVSTAAVLIPVFAIRFGKMELSLFEFIAIPVFLILTHFANAVISRRCRFNASFITGIWIAGAEMFFVNSYSSWYISDWVRQNDSFRAVPGEFYEPLPDNVYELIDFSGVAPLLFAVFFLICCMLCYSSGALLNAAESNGEIGESDCSALGMSQGLVIFFTTVLLIDGSPKTAGVILAVMVLLYALITVAFTLKFRAGCKVNTALINLGLVAAELALFLLIDAGNWQYIALHSFAAAVLIAGCCLERPLFKNWGIALLIIAELRFFAVLVESLRQPESFKLSAVIINLILWFGIMAVLSTRKVRETVGFRLYTFAALLNAGILCSNLICSDLMRILRENSALLKPAQRSAFSGLLCAAVWMILGFTAGKLPHLKTWKAAASITHYGIGFICLAWANLANTFSNLKNQEYGTMLIVATVIVNVVSVLAVLDITLQISEKATKFSRAIGLVVSGYAMLSLTTILGTNNVVKFTSCIISIIYLAVAAAWIVIGFLRNNPLLRRFGLALALFSSAKLFLFDFSGVDAFGRTILFIGFGITLLGISFAYAIMEKRLSRREKKSEPVDKPGEK